MAEQQMSFVTWKLEVDRLLEEKTGCNWQELELGAGDTPLQEAYAEGKTPEQFVTFWCEKNSLWDIREGN